MGEGGDGAAMPSDTCRRVWAKLNPSPRREWSTSRGRSPAVSGRNCVLVRTSRLRVAACFPSRHGSGTGPPEQRRRRRSRPLPSQTIHRVGVNIQPGMGVLPDNRWMYCRMPSPEHQQGLQQLLLLRVGEHLQRRGRRLSLAQVQVQAQLQQDELTGSVPKQSMRRTAGPHSCMAAEDSSVSRQGERLHPAHPTSENFPMITPPPLPAAKPTAIRPRFESKGLQGSKPGRVGEEKCASQAAPAAHHHGGGRQQQAHSQAACVPVCVPAARYIHKCRNSPGRWLRRPTAANDKTCMACSLKRWRRCRVDLRAELTTWQLTVRPSARAEGCCPVCSSQSSAGRLRLEASSANSVS